MALLHIAQQALAGEDDPIYSGLIREQYNRNSGLHLNVGLPAMIAVRDRAITSRPRRRQIRQVLARQLYARRLETEYNTLLRRTMELPPAIMMNDMTTFWNELVQVTETFSRLPVTDFTTREIRHLQEHFPLNDILREARWLDRARRQGRLGDANSVSTPTTRMMFGRRSLERRLLRYADRIAYVRTAIQDNRDVNEHNFAAQIDDLELQNRFAASLVDMQRTIPYDEAYTDAEREDIAGQISHVMNNNNTTLMEQIRAIQSYRVLLAFDGIMHYRRHQLPPLYTILRATSDLTPQEGQQLRTRIWQDVAQHLDPVMTQQQRTHYIQNTLLPLAYQLRRQHGG